VPTHYTDKISRLEDIESLLITAQGLAARLLDSELNEARRCIRSALDEVRNAEKKLAEKWKRSDER
jgi:hypothetical protein